MTFHIAFRTTLLTGCDRFNHFLQLTPLLELEKVFGSRLTGRETFPFVSKKGYFGFDEINLYETQTSELTSWPSNEAHVDTCNCAPKPGFLGISNLYPSISLCQ